MKKNCGMCKQSAVLSKQNKSICPCADHVGYASCAYASQFCICASFLRKTYPLHLLIQVIRIVNMQQS